MAERFDLLIRGGTVVSHRGVAITDLGVRNGTIAAIGTLGPASARTVIEADGLHVLPGAIDTQVHFREPGFEHKEDLETGTRAAVLGGVTAVFDMPNTTPTTTDAGAFSDKLARLEGRVWCDVGLYVGATPENCDELPMLERLPGCCGVKAFMGKSTGSLLIPDDETLRRVLLAGNRRMAVHAEDEARLRERRERLADDAWVGLHPVWRDDLTAYKATERLVALARECQRRVHVLHVTTAKEMELLAHHKDIVTAEVTPQHLTLVAPDCYDRLGTLAQMNPPIRGALDRDGLWKAVREGVVDVIGSDHAPHTLDEKNVAYPNSPSGMPGVQTLLPVMLDHVNAGRLSLEHLVDLISASPARLFGIVGKGRVAVGYDADLVLVDLRQRRTITNEWIASRCGWTPFAGHQVTGWPRMTVVRGHVAMREDEVQGQPEGKSLRFLETLRGADSSPR